MNIDNVEITSKLIFIVGPTASGKSELSIELAKKLNCDIINGDAFQVYKKMDIGTAKITSSEMSGIKHHLIDIVEYDQKYSVSDFQIQARKIIDEKILNNEYIIVVGGSNLYVDSILYNYKFNNNSQYEKLKNKFESYDLVELQNIINKNKIDINNSDFNNHKRLVNIVTKLELNLNIEIDKKVLHYNDFQIIGIYVERESLYKKINHRVDIMFDKGLIEEVKQFNKEYQSQQAIGYKEVHSYLEGKMTYYETVDLVKQKSRNYAKRQMTWYSKNMAINWYTKKDDKLVKIEI